MAAPGAEEGLREDGVDEELVAVAARPLWDLEPPVLLGCVVAELVAVAVAPVLAADVAELFAAVATGRRIVSARISLLRALGGRERGWLGDY